MDKVYVFGHQNPDTDSVCSAISYSYLKNRIENTDKYIPVSLKEASKETRYVLDHFGVKHPKVVGNLKPQVSDISLSHSEVVRETDSIRKSCRL